MEVSAAEIGMMKALRGQFDQSRAGNACQRGGDVLDAASTGAEPVPIKPSRDVRRRVCGRFSTPCRRKM
jgi:hypothetical protein